MKDQIITFIKSWAWIIVEMLLYLIFMFAIGLGLTGVISAITPSIYDSVVEEGIINPYHELWVSYVPMFIGALLALWIVHVLIFKRDIKYTGIVADRIIAGTSYGGVMAFIMLLVGFVFLWSVGWLRVDSGGFDAYLFFGFLLFFTVQSSFEEIVSRAFMIPTIERRSNVWAGILVSSALFAVLHGSNPNITILALTNICLAGILLGALFVRYRSIWPAIGLHIFWNFLQGSFFGFEVSGIDVYSVIETTETGPDLITGGAFGYEGSLLGALSLVMAIYIVWRSSPTSFQTLVEYRTENSDKNIPLAQ